MTELYREVDYDTEFRGDKYFDATCAEAAWNETSPKRWKFAIYPDDQFILRAIGDNQYEIVAVKVDHRWGIAHNTPHVEYRVTRGQIKHLRARQ